MHVVSLLVRGDGRERVCVGMFVGVGIYKSVNVCVVRGDGGVLLLSV